MFPCFRPANSCRMRDRHRSHAEFSSTPTYHAGLVWPLEVVPLSQTKLGVSRMCLSHRAFSHRWAPEGCLHS